MNKQETSLVEQLCRRLTKQGKKTTIKTQHLNSQLCGNITSYEENIVFLMGRNELSSAVVVVVVISMYFLNRRKLASL